MSQRDNLDLAQDGDAEFRDVVLKSGFSGVAATVLVVAMCSPAGLGGMIGTSVASSLGFGAKTGPDANATNFANTPAPLTSAELTTIHERLASSAAQIDNIRAATDSEIQYMREIASSSHIALATPVTTMPAHVTQVAADRVAHPSSVASASAPAYDPHLELAALLLPEQDDQPLFAYQD